MADGRPHKKPPSWYDNHVRKLEEQERNRKIQDQIDEIKRTPLMPGVVLDRAEQVAIRESCTVRVRR